MRNAAVVLLLVASCGGSHAASQAPAQPISNATTTADSSAPAPAPAPAAAVDPYSIDSVIAKMDEFKTKMCQCRDPACAQHVSDEMTAWGQAMAKRDDPAPKLTDDQIKRMTEVTKDMTECMVKAMNAGSPSGGP